MKESWSLHSRKRCRKQPNCNDWFCESYEVHEFIGVSPNKQRVKETSKKVFLKPSRFSLLQIPQVFPRHIRSGPPVAWVKIRYGGDLGLGSNKTKLFHQQFSFPMHFWRKTVLARIDIPLKNCSKLERSEQFPKNFKRLERSLFDQKKHLKSLKPSFQKPLKKHSFLIVFLMGFPASFERFFIIVFDNPLNERIARVNNQLRAPCVM